nr:MAG TPA: hypothetical protein [Bacteriophage sp.]
MRVISQDGTMDIRYENFAFGITLDNCVVASRNLAASPQELLCGKMAKYSSKEKALKAMEILRETYLSMPIVMQNVDVSEYVVKEFEKLKKCDVMVRVENQPSKVDFVNNAVFQFPQDDEIEVVE